MPKDSSACEAQFEATSWHDDSLYGISIRSADPDADDWRSDLLLEIDHIVEWVCDPHGRCRFRVAPAALVFHGVTDLAIRISLGQAGFPQTLSDMCIDSIGRDRVYDRKVYLDRPYYVWTISLSSPKDGAISFGAWGYTQRLLGEPVLCDQQHLSPSERDAFAPLCQRWPARGSS